MSGPVHPMLAAREHRRPSLDCVCPFCRDPAPLINGLMTGIRHFNRTLPLSIIRNVTAELRAHPTWDQGEAGMCVMDHYRAWERNETVERYRDQFGVRQSALSSFSSPSSSSSAPRLDDAARSQPATRRRRLPHTFGSSSSSADPPLPSVVLVELQPHPLAPAVADLPDMAAPAVVDLPDMVAPAVVDVPAVPHVPVPDEPAPKGFPVESIITVFFLPCLYNINISGRGKGRRKGTHWDSYDIHGLVEQTDLIDITLTYEPVDVGGIREMLSLSAVHRVRTKDGHLVSEILATTLHQQRNGLIPVVSSTSILHGFRRRYYTGLKRLGLYPPAHILQHFEYQTFSCISLLCKHKKDTNGVPINILN